MAFEALRSPLVKYVLFQEGNVVSAYRSKIPGWFLDFERFLSKMVKSKVVTRSPGVEKIWNQVIGPSNFPWHSGKMFVAQIAHKRWMLFWLYTSEMMKWLEMTIFVVFLRYPFNVKVGNVKEFAVECPSPGQSRWMACSGCSKSSGKLWFEAWISPVTSSQLSDGVFLSPQQLVQSIKTNRSPNLVGMNFLNFLVCPRLIYNPKWDGMGVSKHDLRPGGKEFSCVGELRTEKTGES